MSITHEQARKLIQRNMDQGLNMQESATLSAHLRDCNACTLYAGEIKEVEKVLLPLLKRQWNVPHLPLSIPALTGKTVQTKPSTFLTIRTAAISLFFMALFFSAWQLMSSGSFESNDTPLTIQPVPTPFLLTARSTSTQLTLEGCARISYIVQQNDTLAGIAAEFSVSEEAVMQLNHLAAVAVRPGVELEIPLCDFTPTGTSRPGTFTTTITPVLNDSTTAPGT